MMIFKDKLTRKDRDIRNMKILGNRMKLKIRSNRNYKNRKKKKRKDNRKLRK